jgi:predicted enzyme related to lactoylglutathione lyase
MSTTTTNPIRHAIHWFEIPVSDMARSQRFYEQLLGISLRVEDFGGSQLGVFPADGAQGVKGALMKVDRVAPHTDGVLLYLNACAALQPVLDRVVALGGQVLLPRTQLPPGMGCFAHIADVDGQRIGLHAQD